MKGEERGNTVGKTVTEMQVRTAIKWFGMAEHQNSAILQQDVWGSLYFWLRKIKSDIFKDREST